MISPGAAEVIYPGHDAVGPAAVGAEAVGVLADALRVPESDVRMFGRSEPARRRPLGVAVVTAADVQTARDRARQMSGGLRTLWRS
jgi:phosphoribosylglycinamide formyltransferase 2